MFARINRLALPRAASRQLSVAHNKVLVDSPYTGGVVAEIPLASEREAAEVVAKAAAAQRAWKETSLESRKLVVQQFLKSVEHNRDAIAKVVPVPASPSGCHGSPTVMIRVLCACAQEISVQMGKPLSQAKGEVNGMKERTNAFLDMAATALETETFPESNGIAKQIVKEPVGVVFSIAPWNYPLLTSVNSGELICGALGSFFMGTCLGLF
jgi:acyl-CoA reductase-like NAD-dependent aldehyde dehydrogenase